MLWDDNKNFCNGWMKGFYFGLPHIPSLMGSAIISAIIVRDFRVTVFQRAPIWAAVISSDCATESTPWATGCDRSSLTRIPR